jgi:phosphoglycerate kinase
MAVTFIDDIDVKGKRVFVRADFNVPLDDSKNIADDIRIRATLPTLQHILKNGGALIIASHLGRPKGSPDPGLSLRPVADRLSDLLGKPVLFAEDCIGEDAGRKAEGLKPGQILLLENLRFHSEEKNNDESFARQLAAAADVYINDAFAVSHRAHASVEAITRVVPVCAAGFLVKKEVTSFEKAMKSPARPLAAVIGGAKVSGKLEVLENIISRVNSLLIGGGMAYTFLKAQGKNVGNSMLEEDLIDTAASVMKKAEQNNVQLLLPADCVIAEELKSGVTTKIVTVDDIPNGWMGLDIGPDTIQRFSDVIAQAKTIVWNGPMGVFEIKEFSKGTFSIAQAIADADAMSVVGGGDTASALHQAGCEGGVSFESTAGGAFMEMMEGKTLPGIAALER